MRLQQLDYGIHSNQSNKWVAVAAGLNRKKQLVRQPLEQESSIDNRPGWYWRSAEGQRFIQAQHSCRACPDPLDDPEIGWQREED